MFDIIVVTYNPGEKLKTTLDSIYSQDFWDYRVVIKDGASTDNSLNILRDSGYFDDFKSARTTIIEAPDKGIYDAMNVAVESLKCVVSTNECKGGANPTTDKEYILHLNCGDTFSDRQVLGDVNDYIEEQDISADSLNIFYGDQFNLMTKTRVSSAPKINDFALYRNVPCHQVCFYDRRLFDNRGYELKYKVRADYEHFLYCIYEEGANAHHMERVICRYEGGGFSETAENRLKSASEHREITDHYMGRKAIKYRMIMALTLQPLRTRLAESEHFSKMYNKVKTMIYKSR